MTIAYNGNTGHADSSGVAVGCAYTSNVSANTWLLIAWRKGGGTGQVPTAAIDTRGNTAWTTIIQDQSTDGFTEGLTYVNNTNGAGANTVTLTFTGIGSFRASVAEFTCAFPLVLDGTPSSAQTPNSATPAGGSISALIGSLIIGSAGDSGDPTWTAGSGYTSIYPPAATVFKVGLEYQIAAAAGSFNAGWTMAGVFGGDWAAFTAAFKENNPNVSASISTPGAITIAGQSITSSNNLAVSISTAGSLTVAGQTVTAGFAQTISNGSIVIAGQSIASAVAVDASSGALTIAGQTVTSTINNDRAATIDTAGAIIVAGQSVTSGVNNALTAGAIVVAGQTVTFAFDQSIHVSIDVAGAMTVAGQSATGDITGGPVNVSIDVAGALLIKGQDLGISGGGATSQRLTRDGRRRGRMLPLFGRG